MTLSTNGRREAALVGRSEECARLDRLLVETKAGRSAILVLRGAAGTGKTALLDYTAGRAEGYRVVRAAGAESEMELPFAGLHQLCAPLLDRLEHLPPPQRDALATAFALCAGPQPDRFFIGLAVLSLLSECAEEVPLLCLVDDAQWLDRSSVLALAFVARRLGADSVGVVFAVREPAEVEELARLPDLRVAGLSDADARELLASVLDGPLDERVRRRILAEARGNPLALLELPRELSPARLAGGFGLPGELPLQSRLEASFRLRVERLPEATRRLLLLAAAEPTGDLALLSRSADELGIEIEAMAPAVGDGVLELGARVAFRHPLLRSSIYRAAPAEDRRAAHRMLAAATDAEVDPDRRAWHLARAALAPDERVADELERSAGRAQARGGLAAAGAFLARAAELTLDPAKQARRALEGAEAKQLAGAPRRRCRFWRWQRTGRWRNSTAPCSNGSTGRSPLTCDARRTPCRCSSTPRGGLADPIPASRARPTSRHSERPALPVASVAAWRPRPRARARRRPPPALPMRSTCCSTAWPLASRMATRRALAL